jgi:hypothetical protein
MANLFSSDGERRLSEIEETPLLVYFVKTGFGLAKAPPGEIPTTKHNAMSNGKNTLCANLILKQ